MEDDKGSLVMVFACEAGRQASAVSSVAKNLFERLEDFADQATGCVKLPEALIGDFDIGNNGEVLPKNKRELILRFEDWEQKAP